MDWFIQSDQIEIDGDEAWLIDRNENALYKMDFSGNECELVSILPTPLSIEKEQFPFYRVNPYCYKKGSYILFMPDRGDSILIYDLKKKGIISKIEVSNPASVRLSIHDYWEDNGKLWIVSYGLSQIFVVDVERKKIEEYYDIFDDPKILPGYEAEKIGDCIFNVSRNSNKICEFDIALKTKKIYEIHELLEGLYTICYESGNFWFSGISGRIYLWKKNQEEFIELNKYPKDLKIYKEEKGDIKEVKFPSEIEIPIFYRSFFLGKYICFLPFNSNQALCNKLLYVNRENCEMKTLKVTENDKSIKGVYSLEYLSPEGMAGILYESNNYISEITADINITNKRFLKKKQQTALLYRNINRYDVVCEAPELALKEYGEAVQMISYEKAEKACKYGKTIFNKLLKEC